MALGAMPLASAQDATPDPDAKPGGTLRVGLSADPAELDPHKTNLTAAWHIIEHVYNGLVTTNPSLEPVPSLAESWEVSEDGLTYTFNLRQGVLFHDTGNVEFAALCAPRPVGMTGASRRPSLAMPSRTARPISSSLHPPMPVSTSGVMLAA